MSAPLGSPENDDYPMVQRKPRCAYCTKPSVAVEWDGDAKVPVCRTHVEARTNG